MLIRVVDDGVGMNAERLEALRRRLADPGRYEDEEESDKPSAGGVGVRNVQERIHLYFGAEYGLSFESSPGLGTTALIRIPLVEEAGL